MQAVYLEASLNGSVDNNKEVIKRIGEATTSAKKTKSFRGKIPHLHQMEAPSLEFHRLQQVMIRTDAFQMIMLRRVIGVPPTHIDRSCTNQ